MKIILKEDVQNLGYKDDVVEVKDGYGRNYLIPQGKPLSPTPQTSNSLRKTSASAPTSSRKSRPTQRPLQLRLPMLP